MQNDNSDKKTKIALIQCICPHYRVPLFQKLAKQTELTLFHGSGEKKGAWQNTNNFEDLNHKKLLTLKIGFHIGNHPVKLVWFPFLFWRLVWLQPQTVISEGVTNIINNISIWLYCSIFSIPMIIWDGGRKIEKPMGRVRTAIEPINKFIFRQAKSMIAYSSVAKKYFLSINIPEEKIFIAQNTIDVTDCLKQAQAYASDPTEVDNLRTKLKLENKKVFLYVGALEKRKKIDVLIEAFCEIKKDNPEIGLIIIGGGPERQSLEQLVQQKKLSDCIFTGKIVEGKDPYLALCDCFVLPGRGGLAINEAFAYGKPVIVGEGDGTESDLITNGLTGFLLSEKADLKTELMSALNSQNKLKNTTSNCQNVIKKYNLENMTQSFLKAIAYASNKTR